MSINQLSSGPELLLLEASFPTDAQMLFSYWTQPALLQSWWPAQAEIQAYPGGSYHLSWPQMNWHLRGRYTTFEPAQKLVFSWHWDHDPSETEKVVTLVFEQTDTSETRLTLTHAPYTLSEEDQDLRLNHHLSGWLHFLPRLEEQIRQSSTDS